MRVRSLAAARAGPAEVGNDAARCECAVTTMRAWRPLAQGLPRSAETLQFAEELLARTPRAGADPSGYRERERAAAALARANAAYALLCDDEEDGGGGEHLPAPTTAPVPKPAKQKKLRRAKARWPAPRLGAAGV